MKDPSKITILAFETNPIWDIVMEELDEAQRDMLDMVRHQTTQGEHLQKMVGGLDTIMAFKEHLQGLRVRARQLTK